MKNTMKIGALVLLVSMILTGCANVFHNGTVMALSQVKVTGLPANPYSAGKLMVFSYNLGSSKWVHDEPSLFADVKYRAAVSADGSLTYTFNPPLLISTPTLTFLLIDSGKVWGTFQLDKKVAGKKGGDVSLDNTWSGYDAAKPEKFQKVLGTVSGDDVTWAFE